MTSERYLSFAVQGVEYAIEALLVQEIVALPPVTRVPGAPPHVRGVVNLRGRIVPVVDLRSLLAIRAGGPPVDGPHTSVVVVESDGLTAGLIVDEVNAILDVEALQIRSPAADGPVAGSAAVYAVADIGDRSLPLIDPDRAFAVDPAS